MCDFFSILIQNNVIVFFEKSTIYLSTNN